MQYILHAVNIYTQGKVGWCVHNDIQVPPAVLRPAQDK